jgi:hypothetical protein
MNEDVFRAILRRDKTKTFGRIEEFYGALHDIPLS